MTRLRTSPRSYSSRTLKVLWGRAAGRCAMRECRIELLVDDSAYDPVVIIGDIAHVEASSNAGPRGKTRKALVARDEYGNLILLCKNCHGRIDGQKRKFTVDKLQEIKAEHEAWVRASLPERGRSRQPWTVIVLEGVHPIDLERAVSALHPDHPEKAPQVFTVHPDRENWQQLRNRLASSVQEVLEQSDPFSKRFAVFPLAPVSACVALGFYLTDRPRVGLFQYHRHAQSWAWAPTANHSSEERIVGLPITVNRKRGDVIVCFEISAAIQKAQVREVGQNVIGTVRLQVPTPSTEWLRAPEQLDTFGQKTHELFEKLMHRFPAATCWHLLVAAPAPAAVKIGQTLNPSMIPPVQLYEFSRSETPPYSPSVRLEGGTQ